MPMQKEELEQAQQNEQLRKSIQNTELPEESKT